MNRSVLLLSCVLGIACDRTKPATTPDGGGETIEDSLAENANDEGEPADNGRDDGAEPGPTCNSAARPLPEGLIEIGYDDGIRFSHVRETRWVLPTDARDYVLGEEVLHEAVRFELEHPALIYGFKVVWADVPEYLDPDAPIEAGLHHDFGYNGFDFWPEPSWKGARCAGDIVEGEWVTYVLPEPLVVEHPGLVYVAHRTEGPGSGAATPVWFYDSGSGGSGTCERFDDCRSAFNLPEAERSILFNGISFPFHHNFLVRLYVRYLDDVAPSEKTFQPVPGSPSSVYVSWGDYDNDGYDDLLLGGPTLYRNNGDGTFTDVTTEAGIAGTGNIWNGGVWGDYDNDGCLDLFVFSSSFTEPDALFRSRCDGTFEDVTEAAGIVDERRYNDCGDPANIRSPSAAAAWVDLDADGFLDLYVSNFVCGADLSPYVDNVFRNKGDGTFENWTGMYGFRGDGTPSQGVAPIDHDRDGDVDILVSNYFLSANLFYDNLGDGRVLQRARALGLAGEPDGIYYGHTVASAWGDLDNDGDFDVIQANLAHPRFYHFSDKTRVLLNNGAGRYEDISGDWSFPASDAGLRFQETHVVPALADFDHDGNLDLVITCMYDGRPTDFYWGNGDGTFRLDSYRAGIGTENGYGVASADFEGDGDPDLFATTLFENTRAGREHGHWLQVRVVGNVRSNRAGIGATVEVVAGGRARIRHVQGGTGKGGQDSLAVHFGLGDATSVDEIRVLFVGGGEVVYRGPLPVDRRIWVYEDGRLETGWAPPGSR